MDRAFLRQKLAEHALHYGEQERAFEVFKAMAAEIAQLQTEISRLGGTTVDIISDFGVTRVIRRGLATDGDNIIVQIHENGGWVDKVGYNSLSDDYAYTNAREHALSLKLRVGNPSV